MSSDIGVFTVGYFQTPQITTMAGYIFSPPSEGKGLVVVNIFAFDLRSPRLSGVPYTEPTGLSL